MQYFIELILTITPLLTWLYLLFIYANENFRPSSLFWTNKIVLDYQKIKPVTFKKKTISMFCDSS